MYVYVDVCAVKCHLILHRRHIIALLSPVDGVWIWCVAPEVVPLGSRAVLEKGSVLKKKKSTVTVRKYKMHV